MLNLILENSIPEKYLNQIQDCVKYWNDSGDTVLEKNKSGIWGDPETQKLALELKFEDFIMHMFTIDCQQILSEDPSFQAGKSGSHVWIHYKKERIAMAKVDYPEIPSDQFEKSICIKTYSFYITDKSFYM
jgi:hypothetical protein